MAEVRIVDDGAEPLRHKIVITGEINVATLADFSHAMGDPRIAQSSSKTVELESPGGSLTSAMAIGVLVREGHFDTAVAARGKCYSACVLILAAGVHRTVASGKVGVHRPYYDTALYVPGSALRANAEPGPVTEGPVTEGMHQYLKDMGLRDGLVDAMMKVPSKFMRHLTSREVAVYGLDNSAPCEIVKVAAVESGEPPVSEATTGTYAKKSASKAKRVAERKSKPRVVNRRQKSQVRQTVQLQGPWSRSSPLTPAIRLKREYYASRY